MAFAERNQSESKYVEVKGDNNFVLMSDSGGQINFHNGTKPQDFMWHNNSWIFVYETCGMIKQNESHVSPSPKWVLDMDVKWIHWAFRNWKEKKKSMQLFVSKLL